MERIINNIFSECPMLRLSLPLCLYTYLHYSGNSFRIMSTLIFQKIPIQDWCAIPGDRPLIWANHILVSIVELYQQLLNL